MTIPQPKSITAAQWDILRRAYTYYDGVVSTYYVNPRSLEILAKRGLIAVDYLLTEEQRALRAQERDDAINQAGLELARGAWQVAHKLLQRATQLQGMIDERGYRLTPAATTWAQEYGLTKEEPTLKTWRSRENY